MMKKKKYDLIVIGGGAAGLMAAGTAGELGKNVLLLEKMEKNGRKIRITGKGRCNMTNDKEREEFLSKVRSGGEFIQHSFDAFSNLDTIAFFNKIGLDTVVERGGRIYPKSGDSWDVVRSLEVWCSKHGVEVVVNNTVTNIKEESGVIVGVELGAEFIACDNVIIATGGVSYPSTGSTGDGYRFASGLGHTIEPIRPSLVPFDIDYNDTRSLSGLLIKNIELSLSVNDEIVDSMQGDVEFFSFGIGGATTFRLSRKAVDALYEGHKVDFLLDLKPALSQEKLFNRVKREVEADSRLTLDSLLRKLMPMALMQLPLSQMSFSKKQSVSKMSEGDIKEIVKVVKGVVLGVIDHRGFREAVITAGGVVLSEVDASTMQSKLVKGLYFAGEVLDIDADTGGYNLQLAFSTGRLAGALKI